MNKRANSMKSDNRQFFFLVIHSAKRGLHENENFVKIIRVYIKK